MKHGDPQDVRRSTRKRKFTYDTFNQNLMGDAASAESTEIDETHKEVEVPAQPKRSHRHVTIDPPEAVNEVLDEIFSWQSV
jgi:hypothetical protein